MYTAGGNTHGNTRICLSLKHERVISSGTLALVVVCYANNSRKQRPIVCSTDCNG